MFHAELCRWPMLCHPSSSSKPSDDPAPCSVTPPATRKTDANRSEDRDDDRTAETAEKLRSNPESKQATDYHAARKVRPIVVRTGNVILFLLHAMSLDQKVNDNVAACQA